MVASGQILSLGDIRIEQGSCAGTYLFFHSADVHGRCCHRCHSISSAWTICFGQCSAHIIGSELDLKFIFAAVQVLYIMYSTLMIAIVCTQVNSYQTVKEFTALQFPISTLVSTRVYSAILLSKMAVYACIDSMITMTWLL